MGVFNREKHGKKEEEIFNELNLLSPKIFSKKEAKKKYEDYFRKLRSAIYSEHAKNIAITGSYGSGKTTLIKNFQNVYDEREYLNISLATFKEEENYNLTGDKLKNLERQIELSILQQILYHVNPSDIPNSNLKRIKSISSKAIIPLIACSLLWLGSIVVLFKFKYLYKLNPYTWDLEKEFDWIIFSTSILFFTGLSYFIYWLIRALNNININKLKIFDSELELGKDLNKSILNEHIDEIIYFFQQTKFDVVVFEDIDRFENTEIFTKLREINLLLNQTKLINRKELKKVVFIYAIRDDKFKDNERTKFFDYIIPIIPFVNPDNANDQLFKLIKSEKLEKAFNKNFINDITKLIDEIDMRLLINIFNEFIIYKSQVLKEDLNQDRNNNLLGIIIYKNLYPDDFSLLSKREGELFKFLNNKTKYIEKMILKIEDKLSQTKEKIQNLEKEKIQSSKDLRAIYINALNQQYSNLSSIQFDNQYIRLNDLNHDKYFKQLQNTTYLSYSYIDSNRNLRSSSVQFSFNSFEKKVDNFFTYDERELNIKNEISTVIDSHKKEIEKFRNEIIIIKNWELSRILQETEVELDFDKLKNKSLLNYLLINGYINENYKHYISLFHDENLTRKDYDFEIKLKSGEVSEFNYQLVNVENLVNELDAKYFERQPILNHQILNYLLTKHLGISEKATKYITQLGQEKDDYLDYIYSYVKEEKQKDSNNLNKFFTSICHLCPNIWTRISLQSFFSDEEKEEYFIYILRSARNRDIFKLDNQSELNQYISDNINLLNLFSKNDFNKIYKILQHNNIKLKKITPLNKANEEFFELVYNGNNYQINTYNIKEIISAYHSDDSIRQNKDNINNGFDSNNYQFILESNCDILIEYLNNNFEDYVEEVYLVTSVNHESEDILIQYFVNNTKVKESLRKDILYKTSTLFSDITTIQNNYHKQIVLASNKIKPTWTNISEYLLHLDSENTTYIDDTLIKFYNQKKNFQALSKTRMRPSNVKEGLKEFYDNFEYALLKCKELTDEAYLALLNSSCYNYNSLGFENLNPEKVKMLLDIKKLNLTTSNYDKLRERFPKYHIALIESNQEKFTQNKEDYYLESDDYFDLLNSDKIKNDNKLSLLPIIDNSYLNNKKLANKIIDLVLETSYNDLSFGLLKAIIDNNTNMEKVMNLVNLYINEIALAELIELIQLMPYSYSSITSKTQTKIEDTSYNQIFVSNLQLLKIVGKAENTDDGKIKFWMKNFSRLL